MLVVAVVAQRQMLGHQIMALDPEVLGAEEMAEKIQLAVVEAATLEGAVVEVEGLYLHRLLLLAVMAAQV
jgi:hypothetical protein